MTRTRSPQPPSQGHESLTVAPAGHPGRARDGSGPAGGVLALPGDWKFDWNTVTAVTVTRWTGRPGVLSRAEPDSDSERQAAGNRDLKPEAAAALGG